MAASKSGMELAPMKQLLNKAAPDNPIPFAFGMGAEPGFALLMLDKAGKNPKGVLKALEDEFKDAKNTRWGTAVVEPERATLVKFIVNKPVSGMAKRLVKTLKGTGYNKAEIVLEDGTVVEGAADEEDVAATAPAAPGAPPPPPPGQGPQDKAKLAAELEAKLKALLPRIGPAGAAQPDMLDQLKKFATDANVNIKTGNLVYANTYITQLATALDKIGAPPVAPGAPTAPPPPPPPGENKPAHTAAELEAKLKELIPRIGPAGANNPELLAQLKKFATDANVNIKTNNLTYANVAITQLATALDKAAPGGGTPDIEKLRNTLANMQLAIVKLGGPQEDAMSTKAGEIGDLLAAGNIAEAQRMMDELSRQLAAAQAAKEAADLQKALDKQKTRLEKLNPQPAPAQMSIFTRLITGAQQVIDAKDAAKAKQAIKALTEQLDKIAPPEVDAGEVDYAKSGEKWIEARTQVNAEIEKLKAALVSTYQADGMAGDVEKAYSAVVAPVMTAFDDSLATALTKIGGATDPTAHGELVEEARAILSRYESALANPVIADLDNNPFVPLAIHKTLSGTLSGLMAEIR
jgi:hypothetical protein